MAKHGKTAAKATHPSVQKTSLKAGSKTYTEHLKPGVKAGKK